MYIDSINKIRAEIKIYNEELNKPATDESIDRLIAECKNNGLFVADEFISFLKKINGIEFNGHVHYGVDKRLCNTLNPQDIPGFIEQNQILQDNMPEYLYFGDYDIGWYCFDLKNKKYVELDKPSGRLVKEFNSFEQMVFESLNSSLK